MKRSPKILIVEDEILTAMRIEMDLTDLGYQVCGPVTTGEKAVQIVREENPDIVLLDIRLAGEINGVEAARQMRSFSKTSIIFMTGYSDETLKEEVMQLHPVAYLIKPTRTSEIESAIDSALAG